MPIYNMAILALVALGCNLVGWYGICYNYTRASAVLKIQHLCLFSAARHTASPRARQTWQRRRESTMLYFDQTLANNFTLSPETDNFLFWSDIGKTKLLFDQILTNIAIYSWKIFKQFNISVRNLQAISIFCILIRHCQLMLCFDQTWKNAIFWFVYKTRSLILW